MAKKRKALGPKRKAASDYATALRAGKRRAARSKPGTIQTRLASPDDPITRVAMSWPYDRGPKKPPFRGVQQYRRKK